MADPDDVNFQTDMQTIRDYVNAVAQTQARIATAYTGALANFETTIRSASGTEAKPDIIGAVFKSGLKAVEKLAVDTVKESTGADLGPVVDILHSVADEVDRAAKAAESLEAGEWIKSLRTAVTDAFTQAQSGDDLRRQLEDEYKQSDAGGYIGGVQNELAALQQIVVPKTRRIEVALYEAWINSNFNGDAVDGTGIIEMDFSSDGNADAAVVKAPLGDKIATALNDAMPEGGVAELMDLGVVKKLTIHDTIMCFESNNTVRKSTDNDADLAFLSSPNNWKLFRRFNA